MKRLLLWCALFPPMMIFVLFAFTYIVFSLPANVLRIVDSMIRKRADANISV